MPLTWLLERFEAAGEAQAIVWRGRSCSYAQLRERFELARAQLVELGLPVGASVMLDADFSPGAVALLLAAIQQRCVVVPIAKHVQVDRAEYARISEARACIRLDADDRPTIERFDAPASCHPLLAQLAASGHPGLVLFSSGSTGAPKASLHDLTALLAKYRVPRQQKRTMTF
ncbi:MAG TPA: AMP-binding protein, partial [Enhygromyxa sp.]|nr:AMP-binding protein [Enhygromyxa sp.]